MTLSIECIQRFLEMFSGFWDFFAGGREAASMAVLQGAFSVSFTLCIRSRVRAGEAAIDDDHSDAALFFRGQ
jgi:hypothetical protein